MAASDETLVGRGRSEQLAHRALARASARPSGRTLAAVVAASAFAVVSVAGLGAIADQAAPGEALYVIDRAYESVGRIVGGPVDRSEETMIEALKLIERGNRQAAMDHLARELTVPPLNLADPAGSLAAVNPSDQVAQQAAPGTTVAPVRPVDTAAELDAPTDDEVVEGEDPLKLALEYALAATQAAKNTDDETVTAEADTAVRSVLQLAVAPADTELAAIEGDSEAAAASETSTSTTSTTVSEEPRRGKGNTTTTTTTSVPEEDLSQTGSGGQSSTGEDPGDSQQGAGGSTEPGDGSDTLILPIP